MSEGGFVFNNTVTGNGTNIAQGQTVSQEIRQTFAGESVESEAIFEEVAKAVPPEVVEDTVEPLQTFAAMPIAQLEAPETKAKWTNLIERLAPYGPQIGKGLATFGAAALEALALRNPVVAGVMAVCKLNAAT